MMDLSLLCDEELLTAAGAGDSSAEDELAHRYARLVRRLSRPLFLVGGDGEDLIQEGMLGLLSAIRAFRPENGASFASFAEVCIRNRLHSAVRSALAQKYLPLNTALPMDTVLSHPLFQELSSHPEEQVLAKESDREFFSAFTSCLSGLELRVLRLYLEGLSYGEIARAIDHDTKTVDNAISRIRKKLIAFLQGENSSG